MFHSIEHLSDTTEVALHRKKQNKYVQLINSEISD